MHSTRFWKVQDLQFGIIEVSKLLGTVLGTMGTVEAHQDFVKIRIFYIFHVYVGHPDGTQVVPKISKSKNIMFELSNALSNVLIRHLELNLEKVQFL